MKVINYLSATIVTTFISWAAALFLSSKRLCHKIKTDFNQHIGSNWWWKGEFSEWKFVPPCFFCRGRWALGTMDETRFGQESGNLERGLRWSSPFLCWLQLPPLREESFLKDTRLSLCFWFNMENNWSSIQHSFIYKWFDKLHYKETFL